MNGSTHPARLRRAFSQIGTTLLGVTLMVAAAAGQVQVQGVEDGDVVRGPVEITAVSEEARTLSMRLHLIGPDDTRLVKRSGGDTVHLVNQPGQSEPAPWDATAFPEGEYTLAAYADTLTRSGRQIEVETVRFTVEHPAAAPSQGPTTLTNSPAAAETEEPGPAAPAADDGDESEPAATASAPSPAGPVDVAFAADTPTQRIIGGEEPMAIELEQAQPDSDVLIIAWNDDEREVVSGFSMVLGADGLVPASKLDELPVGNLELQALYREDDRVVRSAKHKFVQQAPAPATAADMPDVSFPSGVAQTLTQGEAAAMPFEVGGDLPVGGDVLLLAWSLDEDQLVPGFAHVLTEGPYAISAEKLNLLPEGRVELQLRPRFEDRILGKIVNPVTVAPAAVADGPDTGNDGGNANDDDADPGDPADDGDAADQGDAGNNPDEVDPDTADPVAPVNVRVRFAGDMPYQYTQGSGTKLQLDVEGELPADADVLLLMWHNDRGEMVEGFAHALTSAPFEFSNAKLDAAPAGNVELQTLLRIPGQSIVIGKRPIKLIDPDNPVEDDAADDGGDTGGDPDYTGLTLSSTGFTKFTKSADTRVIYVAANGSDSNDGLSPQRPMRSPSKAYDKLRHGHPDWLLFKAGDTFTGNLGTISKSGRSASERMVFGVYGEGDRPRFLSEKDTWARKAFNAKGDNLAFVGLHVIASNRVPHRSGFNGSTLNGSWKQGGIVFLGPANNVLIEDCILEYFKVAMVFQSDEKHGYQRGITIRRTSILNSYGHWDSGIGGHSQGVYAQYVDGMLIDECVWDHNGWNPHVDGASRSKFNHNIYIQDDCKNLAVKRSVMSRGSSHGLQLRSGGDVEDNLFVRNALAFFVGLHESKVYRNVVLQSDDIGRKDPRGFGMEVLPCLDADVANNIFSQKIGSADWGPALEVKWGRNEIAWLNGRPFKVRLRDNKVHDWPRYEGRESAIRIDKAATLLENTRNLVDKASGGDSDPPWIDPTRDVESYMKSIGKTASLEAFIKAAAFRPRGVWVEQYSAEAVNLHIRRGFDVAPHD
jgi:hypothetical protein